MNNENTTGSYRAHNITRNTDTITNTHVRKLTSIALMAIMVAGGLTFAIPGMEPAQAAQINSNPNLQVSAEGQNADNEIAATNIVEVIVSDGDINERTDEPPIVTVDDTNSLTMTFYSGAWYAYFASTTIVDTGLIDKVEPIPANVGDDPTDEEIAVADAANQVSVNRLVKGSPFDLASTSGTPADETDVDNDDAINVHLFSLDGTFDVVYERPGPDQTVSMELDDPDVSVSLDRSTYPQNTGVAITIDDQAMNVDPTSGDTWFFSDGDIAAYYGNIPAVGTQGNAEQVKQDANDAAEEVRRLAVEAAEEVRRLAVEAAEPETVIAALLPATVITAAQAEYNEITAAADIALEDPLVFGSERARIIAYAGQGERNVVTDSPTPDDPTTYDENHKGQALVNYEEIAGSGDRTSDNENDDHYKGTAKIAYEEAVGDKTIEDMTTTAYKGSAQVDYEGIAGNPEASAGTAERKGTAQVLKEETTGNPDATEGTAERKGTAQVLKEETTGDPDANDGPEGPLFKGTSQVAYEETLGDAAVPTNGNIASLDAFVLDMNNLLECATEGCDVIDTVTWVKFEEDSSNDSKFTNTSDDEPNLKTTANAQRGLSFSVTYDNTVTSGIGYSTTNIVIDAGDDWGSGEEISITLTDTDANTNSLTEDDLDVTNSDQIIPTIRIGEPFTLAQAGSVTLTTVGAIESESVDSEPTAVSDILVVTLPRLDANSDHILSIDLGDWDAFAADNLPADHVAFKGTHMLNYDISDIGGTSISLVLGDGDPIPLVTGTDGTEMLTGPDFIPGDADTTGGEKFGSLYTEAGPIRSLGVDAAVEIVFTVGEDDMPAGEYSIIIDLFAFGLADKDDLTSNVNDAIYRLELEEDGSNSSDFTGTLEYIGLNQINIAEEGTYTGIQAINDNIILISDDSSISVEYNDLTSTGGTKLFTAEADTPTHSGAVSLDSDGYQVADIVLVTVTDADLNVDSGKADIYTTVDANSDSEFADAIGSENAVAVLLTVSIDGEEWAAGCGLGGLDASDFTLRETENDSGVFTGTFAIPENHCPRDSANAVSVTGTDISVEYTDFRDDSGSIITVSASAGIRSNTGSVSLDRTVYPVPFSAGSFETHEGDLGDGSLTVYVSINDPDYDTSANGIDTIDDASLMISVLRSGSPDLVFDTVGNSAANAISETAPDSGVFEHEMTITAADGPDGRILQGDILHVVYEDPSDASGSANTVTDSATFDLRNGVLQSDQTAYIIGSDAILTLIEPDLNLDSDSTETYDLDLIEWDSDAGTCTLAGNGGDCDDISNPFAPTPSNLLETGTNTGIFQVVVSIPADIDRESLQRGEEITLTYNDWGPSGSDYVGDKDESVTATIYTSNFGATIELDQRVYTWTDKVYVTVVAPDHNIDSDQIDEIGNSDDYPVRVSTRGEAIEEYKLVETGADTGIFTGEVILTGFPHDADGDQNNDAIGDTSDDGSGPTDGRIGAESESGISVSFKFSDGETVSSSALIRWNVGEVQWLEASYPASGSGIVRVIDPDMNLNPEAVDNFDVTVWSDSDGGGIDLTVTETNAATGIFEGTVFFGVGVDTSGHRLRVVEGDTVTAQYYDNTLPAPFKETERLRVGATTLIGTIVPPLERAPISDLRAVDSFGNTLDTISVDTQIQLESDVTNGQDKTQEFAYLIQVQDENGVTVSLNWITGSLTEGQSLSPAVSWTPSEAGTYDVTAFVWESIENPTALSPTATIAITVN